MLKNPPSGINAICTTPKSNIHQNYIWLQFGPEAHCLCFVARHRHDRITQALNDRLNFETDYWFVFNNQDTA